MNNRIKDEAELLAGFCDPDNLREQYRHPFLNEDTGNVWATNAHVLISVAPQCLKETYETSKLKEPPEFSEHTCDHIITMSMMDDALAAVPQIEEQIEVQKAIKCEECEGSGEVEWEYTDSKYRVHFRSDVCPECDGEGILQEAVYKSTGRMVPDPEASIGINDANLLVRDIVKLIDAMQFFGVDQVHLVRYKTITKWVLDDNIFIILASVFGDPKARIKV